MKHKYVYACSGTFVILLLIYAFAGGARAFFTGAGGYLLLLPMAALAAAALLKKACPAAAVLGLCGMLSIAMAVLWGIYRAEYPDQIYAYAGYSEITAVLHVYFTPVFAAFSALCIFLSVIAGAKRIKMPGFLLFPLLSLAGGGYYAFTWYRYATADPHLSYEEGMKISDAMRFFTAAPERFWYFALVPALLLTVLMLWRRKEAFSLTLSLGLGYAVFAAVLLATWFMAGDENWHDMSFLYLKSFLLSGFLPLICGGALLITGEKSGCAVDGAR